MQMNRQTNEPQNKLPPGPLTGCVKTENRKINKKSKNKNQTEHLVRVLTAERGLCSYDLSFFCIFFTAYFLVALQLLPQAFSV